MVIDASIFLLIFLATVHAHEEHHHQAPHKDLEQEGQSINEREVWVKINENYLRDIKPIFQRSCFDCHTLETRYPWYYNLPGAKQLIDRDTREAMKHIDMTTDFPFKGHGSPSEDLEEIKKTIIKDTMPPFRYKIMHWRSRLTEEEKQKIIRWVEENSPQSR